MAYIQTNNQNDLMLWLGVCSCLNGCCTYGQFDTQQVDTSKASTILSHLSLLSFLPSTLNQVGEAEQLIGIAVFS